ncbi:MAG TPA: hypothetical protein ENH13_02135 [Euryarchaeota archaeon]|nr:hypothetical protein [Euryarchaeota archaeon]
MNLSDCDHPSVACLNPYETIRKYQCQSCGEVMMCECEKDVAYRFFPSNLSTSRELKTQNRFHVTLGFQEGVCNSCRGLPEEAYPKAQMYRLKSKIHRYYWREIYFETTKRFADWAESQGYQEYCIAERDHHEVYTSINQTVVKEIKELHRINPKYIYEGESANEVITKNEVDVISLDGVYLKPSPGRAAILDRGEICSVEEFAKRHFERLGYKVLFTESVPFHVLFGVFMWLLIQDSTDSKVDMVGVGDREAFDNGTKGDIIWTLLPEDFGTSGYAQRRAKSIEEHFSMLPGSKEELFWLFEYWVDHSANLRQYLWAHRPQDLAKAKEIISILPADATRQILRYLVEDYWGRYLGWPDMLVYNSCEFFFVEIKSSKDKLSEVQKNWIRGNKNYLHLPFKLVKIHKKGVIETAPLTLMV